MQWKRYKAVFARKALTTQGWQKDVLINIDEGGLISAVEDSATSPPGAPSFDLVLPGMANVHSHAFQRAMTGLTEIASGEGRDNFWSWREVMYKFTFGLTPEAIEIIARALYIELLKHGYTAVGEFHYLHHDAQGKPYANVTELSDRIVTAARAAGIHLTHLPVMYETGNFGGKPTNDGQRRFLNTPDAYLKLLGELKKKYGDADDITLGVAPHSLRAVKPETLRAILEALEHCPMHMHIAEQEKEVADCLQWSRKRPMEWLLDNFNVDARWCLIHATHMTPEETATLAKTGATVGLCPTTEANLGDGIFQAEHFLTADGSFGIGTDSNVCTSPWEELKMMEYAQRLATRRRNVLCTESTPSAGRTLFARAAAGGAKALGINAGILAPETRADLVALSMEHPLLHSRKNDTILDTLIFGATAVVTDVFVAGRRVVENGAHAQEEESAEKLRQIIGRFV